MYILPIIDLWTMRPAAFALVNEQSDFYTEIKSPHELLQIVSAAQDRDFNPLVVQPIETVKGVAWREFRRSSLGRLFSYEDGDIYDDTEVVFSEASDQPSTRWVRNIDTPPHLKEVMEQSVRYGSGKSLTNIFELDVKKEPRLRVNWA